MSAIATSTAALLFHIGPTMERVEFFHGGTDGRAALVSWADENIPPEAEIVELNSFGAPLFAKGGPRWEQRSQSILPLLAAAPDLETLKRDLNSTGAEHLLLVMRPEHLVQLKELPELVHSPALSGCTYWLEFTRWIRQLPRSDPILSDDGLYGLVEIRLPD